MKKITQIALEGESPTLLISNKLATNLTAPPSAGYCPNVLYRAIADICRCRLFKVTWPCNDDIINLRKIGLKANSSSKTNCCQNLMNTKLDDV